MGGAVLVWGDGDGDVSGEQESVGVLRGREADRAVEAEAEAEERGEDSNGLDWTSLFTTKTATTVRLPASFDTAAC